MASITLNVDADVATRVDTAIAAGLGNHLPVGSYGSADYRSAIRFNPPAWSGWNAVTKATLKVWISDHQHVAPKSSSIYVSRMNESGLWTKSEGTQDCESGFSGGNNTQADDIVSTSTGRVSFTSGSTANVEKSIVVTAQVQYYFANKTSKLVFVFDNNGADQYTELWSEQKSGGYNATLVIEYDDVTIPTAPTLTAPADNEVVLPTKPTFDWTPTGDGPQTSAEVHLTTGDGVTTLYTWPVAGATSLLVSPVDLTRGTTYRWRVRTQNSVGWGAWSASRAITIKPNPTVTVTPTRKLVFDPASHAVRMVISWAIQSGYTQKTYRVQTTGYDSGPLTGPATSITLTNNLNRGIAYPVTVTLTDTDDLTGVGTASFTPYWGLTTHWKNLLQVPTNWQTPVIDSTVYGDGALIIEYGSGTDASGPTSGEWYSSISSVPFRQFLFYRAWFIPSATQSPILRSIVIPASFSVASLDDWVTHGGPGGMVAPWFVDTGEYVYGSQSVSVRGAGAWTALRSTVMSLRAGRSYILTGLMRSKGVSGASIRLYNSSSGALLVNEAGDNVMTEMLGGDKDWFTPGRLDVYRYKTPIYKATTDMDVYVLCTSDGAAGSQAWFDAIKLEESTVATPWSPGAVGASVVDAGGVQIDASKGGVFRVRGGAGQLRDFYNSGQHGMAFAGDTELYSPSVGDLSIAGTLISKVGHDHAHAAPTVRTFVAGTVTTYTPPVGCTYIVVECLGGGGGGGAPLTSATAGHASMGVGGAGAGYARKTMSAAAATGAAVSVGVGGAGAVNAGGAPGGTSSFGPVSATGGGGGARGNDRSADVVEGANNGVGNGTGGDINASGSPSLPAMMVGSFPLSGGGGASPLGGGGAPTRGSSNGSFTGDAGNAYGGGGGGGLSKATATNVAGGSGGPGIIVVTEYYS